MSRKYVTRQSKQCSQNDCPQEDEQQSEQNRNFAVSALGHSAAITSRADVSITSLPEKRECSPKADRLVDRAKKGEQAAFLALFQTHARSI
jgi:hypothetical protein